METIDLTGDRERFILFSANDLEKPCRLWAGTSAIKEQCGETRGKKRRSDEYILNPPSPSKHTSSARSSTDDPLSEHSSKTSWVRPPNDAKQPRISSLSPRNGHRKQSIAHYNEENADGFTFDKDPVLRPQSSDISLLTSEKNQCIGKSHSERSPNWTCSQSSTMDTRMEQAKSLKAPTASNRLKTGSSQPED